MSEVNFYKVLRVRPSASAEEIKTAFRELVKRHHPDLFSSPTEKTQATVRLSQINEAYAVLGNAERRQEYDHQLREKLRAQRAKAARPRRVVRAGAKPAPREIKRRKLRVSWNWFSRKRAGYAVAAATLAILLFYGTRVEPNVTPGWGLVEKVDVSSAIATDPRSTARDWTLLKEFDSLADCAGALKTKVREEESRGARAVFDEQNGMMAIIVQVKRDVAREDVKTPSEANPANEGAPAGDAEARAPAASKPTINGVRNLECRATRRTEYRSWAQRMLRQVGLYS